MLPMAEFSQIFRILRLWRGKTQEETASALNVSRPAVSKWEQGGDTDNETKERIADYFQVPYKVILGLDPLPADALAVRDDSPEYQLRFVVRLDDIIADLSAAASVGLSLEETIALLQRAREQGFNLRQMMRKQLIQQLDDNGTAA